MRQRQPYFKHNCDKRTLCFDHYEVVEESKNFYGVYKTCGHILISSKNSWKQATKLAKMLNTAFLEGYEVGVGW